MIRVDYQCRVCGRTEVQVASPPPSELPCPRCGEAARRAFSPVAVLKGDGRPPTAAPASAQQPACRGNPMVPMACHMSPTAGRAWAEMFRSGGSAEVADRLARAREREEAEGLPVAEDAGAHHHGHSHAPAPVSVGHEHAVEHAHADDHGHGDYGGHGHAPHSHDLIARPAPHQKREAFE